MRHTISILIFCFLTPLAFSQQFDGQDAQQNLNQLGTLSPNAVGARGFDNRYEGVKGSPFLFEDWMPGEIYMSNGNEFKEGVKLNYNVETNEIYLQTPQKTVRVLYNTKTERFTIKNESGESNFERFKTTEIGMKEGPDFFAEILYDGKSKLIKKTGINFKKADYQGAYSQEKTFDEYILTHKLFVKTTSGYQKLGVNKSSLFKVFPTKKAELKNHFKQQKVRIDTEVDLIKALIFLDGLE